MEDSGKVYLAGAGPGDAELLTVKAKSLMREADVVVYDALVGPEILCQIPCGKEKIYVGKRGGHHFATQEEINEILLREAEKGKKVLRLKGGDPFVFGRGAEELELLEKAGIPYEVVPGVTSACAVPAYAGIPVTHRDYVSSVHIIAGHARRGGDSRIDYPSLAAAGGTLVFLMGVAELDGICKGLLGAGMSPSTPSAVIMRGTTAKQRTVFARLEELREKAREAKIQAPAVIVVGEVADLGRHYAWEEKRLLSGRMFLVTRPRERISPLAEGLKAQGAHVLEFPTIRLRPKKENKELLACTRKSEGERWLVFTSPSGVRFFFAEMAELGMDLRAVLTSAGNTRLAAIGSGTAKELAGYGLTADVVPEEYCAARLGEAVAESAKPGSEALILRAKEGSKELVPPLQAAGLRVRDISLYETEYPKDEWLEGQILEILAKGELDGVIFTSGSTVRGFVDALPGADFSKIKALCIGRQTEEEALRFGMETAVAKEASVSGLIELVKEQYGRKEENDSKKTT